MFNMKRMKEQAQQVNFNSIVTNKQMGTWNQFVTLKVAKFHYTSVFQSFRVCAWCLAFGGEMILSLPFAFAFVYYTIYLFQIQSSRIA